MANSQTGWQEADRKALITLISTVYNNGKLSIKTTLTEATLHSPFPESSIKSHLRCHWCSTVMFKNSVRQCDDILDYKTWNCSYFVQVVIFHIKKIGFRGKKKAGCFKLLAQQSFFHSFTQHLASLLHLTPSLQPHLLKTPNIWSSRTRTNFGFSVIMLSSLTLFLVNSFSLFLSSPLLNYTQVRSLGLGTRVPVVSGIMCVWPAAKCLTAASRALRAWKMYAVLEPR